MGLLKKIFNNTGKPEGFFGKMMVNSMNSGHSAVSDWGMSFLDIETPKKIIELGCGGGRNASQLMKKYGDAMLTALDYSEVSVKKTIQTNQAAVDCGRCNAVQGNVSQLPFENESFELATAFETVYFWPGPVDSFKEVYRVLKTGSTFLIVNESDGTNQGDEKWNSMIDNMTIYTAEQLCGYLQEAGFSEVRVHKYEKKHWLCIQARKKD